MYSVGQVSERLGIPDKTLYKWVRRENLGFKVGFGWVLLDKDIKRLEEMKLAREEKRSA